MHKTLEIFTLIALLMLTACSSGGDDAQSPLPPEGPDPLPTIPLTFNAVTADKESYSTRATQVGAAAGEMLGSFAVFGVKLTTTTTTPDYTPQTVFAQTPVTYTANTAGTSSTNTADWEYVAGSEYIRYWDQLAEGYVFYGYAPSDLKNATGNNLKATASLGVAPAPEKAKDMTKGTVTISNLQGGAKNPTTTAYLSLPTVINPRVGTTPSFQGAATMTFQQPLARIRIGFLSGEDDYSAYAHQALYIKGVSFAPVEIPSVDSNGDQQYTPIPIIYNGSVTATYDWSYIPPSSPSSPSSPSFPFGGFGCDLKYTSEQTTGDENKKAAIDFNNYAAYHASNEYYTLTSKQYVEDALYAYATETADTGSGQVTATTPDTEDARIEKQWYYVFPQEAHEWRLSLTTTVNGVDFAKTAVVPATYMHWLPNHQYTYIFKVSPVSLSIVGVDVKVMNWQLGGSTESEQHHW